MKAFWLSSKEITRGRLVPKYYDPDVRKQLDSLRTSCDVRLMADLVRDGVISYSIGNEIGKESYGTGDIPFVRTSDISNWEIKTAPKQGVSSDIFERYATKQDVREGDILLVRDGTYLVGTNCFVTRVDQRLLYQSHILKIRVERKDLLSPEIFFLALNSPIVQRQFRAVQFTADIIDTIGQRFLEVALPIPKADTTSWAGEVRDLLNKRARGKAFVKQAPLLTEQCLKEGGVSALTEFRKASDDQLKDILIQDTVTLEFGKFEATTINRSNVVRNILLPKYYDPEIDDELSRLADNCDIFSIGELVNDGTVSWQTGDEIGKLAYGTGDIPFLRTSDFANWEIKHDPKHCVSEEIYAQYKSGQDLRARDILLVRDGTYLVGTSTIVLEEDERSLYCGGIIRLRADETKINSYLLLALLNSYIVKRQIRSKQFTRDVIDTLGRRLNEVRLPVPRDEKTRGDLADEMFTIVQERYKARNRLKALVEQYPWNVVGSEHAA